MSKTPVIALVDPNIMVKTRIHEFLAGENVEIVEIASPMALLSFMAERDYKINLIVTDIEIENNAGFNGVDILSLIRSKSSNIPIMILSSISKKETITRTILSGATEYILKPFEDDFLKKKIIKYLDLEILHEESVLRFNLADYLNSEIYKASKGRYSFTLLRVDFVLANVNNINKENSFYRHADSLYSAIKTLFWDGDLYIPYGFQSHLGFFPFSDNVSVLTVKEKIDKKYAAYVAAHPDISTYKLNHTCCCYPDDGYTSADLLKIVAEKSASHAI